MPAGPGEAHLTTFYSDVHYYFSDPASNPPHHRFDRGSYFYLFSNAAERRSRIEIANHAGTAEQDAAFGYLNIARVAYSYRQPTLCTITIDPSQAVSPGQWCLNAFDIGNEYKHSCRIHTLDVYLWTEKDATQLLGHFKAVLPAGQLDVRDGPASAPAEHRDSMSPVVQQLEQTAIGTSFPPRAESAVSASSLPGPPTPATSRSAAASPPISPPQTMAYNPAAPAAPEPIAHREKTPPPPDDGMGTGLSNVGRYDAGGMQYANVPSAVGGYGVQPTSRAGYFPGPPEQPYMGNPGMGPPGVPSAVGSGALSRAQTFPHPPPSSGPSAGYPAAQQQPQYQHHPSQPTTQYPTYPAQPQGQMSFGPTALASPGLPQQHQPLTPSAPPAYSAGAYQQQQQQQQPQPQPQPQQSYHQTTAQGQQKQIFAYSTYNYNDPSAQGQAQNVYGTAAQGSGYMGDVHSQVYRPTEAESRGGHHHAAPVRANTGSVDGGGRERLEARVDRVEKRVGGFLKKLDKMF